MKKITLFLLTCFSSASLFAQTFTGTGGAIPDNSCTTAHEFPVTVTGVGVLGVAKAFSSVGFNITHSWDADLDIYLIAPDGTTVIELSTDNGSSGDNYSGTIFSPDATTAITAGVAPFTGSFLPEGSFGALTGVNADGTWILRVCDDAGSDVGTLDSWSITFAAVVTDAPDYGTIQSPLTTSIPQGGSVTIYGQVYEPGLTDVVPNIVGQAPGIQAWIAVNATDSNPNTWTTWVPATWNSGHISNNDEYQLAVGSSFVPGTYYYATRYRLNGGPYVYGGTAGFWNGTSSINGVLTVTPPPPPANDECTGAIALTVNPDFLCGLVTAGTVVGATASATDSAACFGAEDDDVWFSFVATATSQRISLLNVAGSTTDMYHSLWTGDCSALTLVPNSCSDLDTSNPTGLVPNQTYYVRVNTYTATPYQTSTFNICIGTPPPPPANDTCAGAITVTCGSATAGTTAFSTNENQAVCGISGVTTQNTPGVWYKYVGDGSDVTVTTCSSTVTTGDSRIAVYSGSCGTLTCIGGNDDAQTSGCANNVYSSIVTFNTVAGTDYYILVYAYSSTALGFELNVSCVAACSPVTGNDDCSTATQVTVGTPITGANNSCSSASLGTAYPSCGSQFGTYYDTWYWFDSGSVTDVTIALSNQTGTTGFVLYSGTCGALTPVTGSCTLTGASTNITGLTPGTYYLRAFSSSPAARGSYDLSITSTLGTGSFDNGSFSFYPNPVKNILNLSYNQEISTIDVFNLLGQKVSANKVNANSAQIDMSTLSKGAYMVKVTSNDQVKTIKVVKE